MVGAYDASARRSCTNGWSLQAMSKELQEQSQVTTAIWGTVMDVSPLDSNGHLRPDAHRCARMFRSDLELF